MNTNSTRIFVCALALAAIAIHAAEFHVATDGNDNNSGTKKMQIGRAHV